MGTQTHDGAHRTRWSGCQPFGHLPREGQRGLTHSSRSLSRKATRSRSSSSESISAGASSPRGLRRSWNRDRRGGGSTTELPGQPETPAAPWDFPGSAPSAAARARCWAQGMHQGCLQGGSHSQPSNHPILPPTLHSLQPSDPAPTSQNPPWPFRDHRAQSDPCPPQPAPAHTVLTAQGWLRSPDLTPSTDPASLCMSQECSPSTA